MDLHNSSKKNIKPFVKWVGGKGQILENIFKYFPKKINNYYEPFLGGGAVFMKLLDKIEKKEIILNGKMYLNDSNKNLIMTYKNIKENVNDLIKKLTKYNKYYLKAKFRTLPSRTKINVNIDEKIQDVIKKGRQHVYYFYRNKFNNDLKITDVEKSALFIFLNKTGFRGLFREGKNGFNVPFGNYDKPNICEKNLLINLNILFNKYNVEFLDTDFKDIFDSVDSGDFVYFDSPYYPLNNKSFVAYQKLGFTEENHSELANICVILDELKIKFLESNSNCQNNKITYKDFIIKEIYAKRRINSKNPNQKEMELLIYN
tara:strand:- start:1701 stop:2648 length:948 start_codon:yes stop_codon:yes gene_type:complete